MGKPPRDASEIAKHSPSKVPDAPDDAASYESIQLVLTEVDNRYAKMVNEVKDYAIFMLDTHGRILTWNSGAQNILGYTEQEAVGQSGELVFTEQDRESGEARKELQTAAMHGRAEDERWHRRKDGSLFFASGIMTALRNPDGSLHGFVKLMRDFTDRKLIEDARAELLAAEQAARQEAEAINRMKDEFLANLSHELRTPISAVVGWARLLKVARLTDEERAHGLEVIERNSTIQAKLIDDLLDTSRIIWGKLELRPEDVDLKAIVVLAIEAIRPVADAKAIELAVFIDAAAAWMKGDSARLQQVVSNLVANAVKFTSEGGRVTIRLACDPTNVRLEVSDTGMGIDPHFLPHVFEKFRQADASPSRQHGGLGLGLAIVRQLVELHGGTVVAESPGLGHGAVFTVIFPRISPCDAAVKEGDRRGVLDFDFHCPPSLLDLRILVVEDEQDMRDVLINVLTLCGCHVTATATVREGIEALKCNKPDLILADIGLPQEDGFSFLREERRIEAERGWSIPVIALTAFAGEEAHKRISNAGFQARISKPIDPMELVTLLDRFMQERQ